MGRPSGFTEEFREAYLEAIRQGNFRNIAARIAKRNPKTVSNWITEGRKGDPRYADFVDEIEEAEAIAIGASVKQIRDAGHEDWKAAKAYLVAKCPEDWGDKARRSAKQAIEEILSVVEAELGRETAARIMEKLAARGGEEEGAATTAGHSEPRTLQ